MSNEIGNESDLTPSQRAALGAIVAGRLAWSSVAALVGGGHAPETLVELAMLDLIELCSLSADLSWTLTPWGAWLLAVRLQIRPVRVEGRKRPRRLLGWVPRHAPEPQERCFRQGGMEPLPWPEEVVDPKSKQDPEYLLDEVTEQPVLLFGSVPVLIDPRLAKRVVRKRGRRRAG